MLWHCFQDKKRRWQNIAKLQYLIISSILMHIVIMRFSMLQAEGFQAFKLCSNIILSFTAIISIFNKDDENIMFKDIHAEAFASKQCAFGFQTYHCNVICRQIHQIAIYLHHMNLLYPLHLDPRHLLLLVTSCVNWLNFVLLYSSRSTCGIPQSLFLITVYVQILGVVTVYRMMDKG